MKHLLSILILSLALFSCVQDEAVPGKHEMVLELYSITTGKVVMYDSTLQKNVTIDYSLDLFKMSMIDLYECQYQNPVFTFYYVDGIYYSL